MTRVAIVPEETESGQVSYRAIAGRKQSVGKTAGEALDALTSSLGNEEAGTLVVVQHQRPDQYFTAEQQKRMNELMVRWRAARDAGGALAATEQAELDALVAAEVRAANDRAAAMLRELEE